MASILVHGKYRVKVGAFVFAIKAIEYRTGVGGELTFFAGYEVPNNTDVNTFMMWAGRYFVLEPIKTYPDGEWKKVWLVERFNDPMIEPYYPEAE